MLVEAQARKEKSNEGSHGVDDPLRSFFDSVDSSVLEDFFGVGDLGSVEKGSVFTSRRNSSPNLVNQFPAPSADPDRKRSIIITVLEDDRVISALVGVASHLRCQVTEEDHAKMNEVDLSCMFNEVQLALNRASVLHHDRFLRYWTEVNQLEAEVKEIAEKRDMYKLLSEQHERVVKNLQSELDAAQKEHANLVEKVQQKIDWIDQLRPEMNEVQAMADVWKCKMDWLASKKETAQAQLASVEVQL
nr:uncharacterized protein LOC117281067 [Nicotiana tomentosiformis]